MSLSILPTKLLQNFSNFPRFLEDFDTELQRLTHEHGLDISIYEEKNNLVVEAPLPGLKSENIEVNLNNGVLWIKGDKKEETSDKDKKFYQKSQSTFSYRIALPEQVDEKQEPKA